MQAPPGSARRAAIERGARREQRAQRDAGIAASQRRRAREARVVLRVEQAAQRAARGVQIRRREAEHEFEARVGEAASGGDLGARFRRRTRLERGRFLPQGGQPRIVAAQQLEVRPLDEAEAALGLDGAHEDVEAIRVDLTVRVDQARIGRAAPHLDRAGVAVGADPHHQQQRNARDAARARRQSTQDGDTQGPVRAVGAHHGAETVPRPRRRRQARRRRW
jgi:hypothetical protein